MLKFFRRGATFIQGGTSIPESRVGLKEMGKFFWEGRGKCSAQLAVSV